MVSIFVNYNMVSAFIGYCMALLFIIYDMDLVFINYDIIQYYELLHWPVKIITPFGYFAALYFIYTHCKVDFKYLFLLIFEEIKITRDVEKFIDFTIYKFTVFNKNNIKI